ncbi:MAG: aldo/keto reductase [Pseudoxanthomonas sp.]
MTRVPTLPLNDGRAIPQFGLGTWRIPAADAAQAVRAAFDLGYRHIDGATIYRNEEGVGAAIAQSGIARDELFITTKLWNSDQGHDSALRALDTSLSKLGLDFVDLYLIHWPCPAKGKTLETWKALIEARAAGKVKSIGVSNFRIPDLDLIIGETGVTPVVNQIELHPWLQQAALRDYHAARGIVTEAWSPLAQGGELLGDPAIQAIARKHGKSAAQVVLRWHMQLGNVVFPKSSSPARIAENIDIFDFALDAEDMAVFVPLERGQRLGEDPDLVA